MTVFDYSVIIFSLVMTASAVILAARRQKQGERVEAVAGRSLGPVVLALGAGATANSGFVLTGAIGLGYTGGLMWCLLPLGWLIGDIIFWIFLAGRVYELSRDKDAVTLPELIGKGVYGRGANVLVRTVTVTVVILMTIYIASQWLSAGKMGGLILGVNSDTASIVFAGAVILYTAVAGVRGAAYTDFVQALFMLALVASIGVVCLSVLRGPVAPNVEGLEPGFLTLTGTLSPFAAVLFAGGFAVAAIGFNLGQPQMVSRWMSAKSVDAVEGARWLYIAFVQATWLSYTVLGTFIRVLTPVSDPEQALVIFVQDYGFPGMMGLLVAGAISTIASTASATIAASVEMIRNDLGSIKPDSKYYFRRWVISIVVGLLTLSSLAYAEKTVFNLAITAVSFLGASLAAPVLFITFGARVSSVATLVAVLSGLGGGIAWRALGLSAAVNEAAPGMAVGCIIMIADVILANRAFKKSVGLGDQT
jgi:sodium/proline symporter